MWAGRVSVAVVKITGTCSGPRSSAARADRQWPGAKWAYHRLMVICVCPIHSFTVAESTPVITSRLSKVLSSIMKCAIDNAGLCDGVSECFRHLAVPKHRCHWIVTAMYLKLLQRGCQCFVHGDAAGFVSLEVLVSSAVKDLVAGSGLMFTARGTHILKGLPGEGPLFGRCGVSPLWCVRQAWGSSVCAVMAMCRRRSRASCCPAGWTGVPNHNSIRGAKTAATLDVLRSHDV